MHRQDILKHWFYIHLIFIKNFKDTWATSHFCAQYQEIQKMGLHGETNSAHFLLNQCTCCVQTRLHVKTSTSLTATFIEERCTFTAVYHKVNNLLYKIKTSFNQPGSLPSCDTNPPPPPSTLFSVAVHNFTGCWWILKQITLIIVFHNCQLCEGCHCAQELFVSPRAPTDTPSFCPTLPNHRGRAYCLQSPELLNQEDTFTDDTFITINQGNLIKEVIPPLRWDSHKCCCNLCPTERSSRWRTETPTDCQPYRDSCGRLCVGVGARGGVYIRHIQEHMRGRKQTQRTLPSCSVTHNSAFANSLINYFNWM